ncbi:hypothetical protein [Dinoroseobacter sp. S124A]
MQTRDEKGGEITAFNEMPGQQESFEAELSDALSRGPAHVLIVLGKVT